MRKHSYTFSGHSLIQYVTLNSLTNPAWKDRQTYTNPWNETLRQPPETPLEPSIENMPV